MGSSRPKTSQTDGIGGPLTTVSSTGACEKICAIFERGDNHAYGAVLEHGIDQLVLEIAEVGKRFAKQKLLESIEQDRSLKLKGSGS